MLAHAWLEQRNRDVMELASGERAIVATPEDYEAAYAVFKATCERSVVNLSDTHRAILDAVYELSSQSAFDGFSLRKIADKAGVHHSTVAEHKTYLTKSAKLLKEVESGLDLVADAEPSWWRKGDLLVGFPRPTPATKERAVEVATLTRTGLEQALEALEGRVDVVGDSGYEVREDIIVAEADRRRKGGAA
jgi:predicted DNA-binding protein YlxM (UPF0122 family)